MMTAFPSTPTFFALNLCLKTYNDNQNIEFRAVIKFPTKEGANAKEIYRRMPDAYGDRSTKYSTVANKMAQCQVAERLVLTDRGIKVVLLGSESSISNGSVFTIINEH